MERHDKTARFELGGAPEGSGLIGRTARTAGVLLIVGLLLAGVLTRAPGTAPEPVARQSPPVGEPRAQMAEPASAEEGYEIIVPVGGGGHFWLDARVNGADVRFLVDTGASTVVLTEADAARAGLRPHALEYSLRLQTANGEIDGAPVMLRRISVGDLELEDVAATVITAPVETSLLGMSFLGRLGGYAVDGDRLVLRW